MDSNNQVESDIRKIQRFFCKAYINYHFFSIMLYQMLGIRGKVTIIIDRSNWDYGKSHINILVAAALYRCPGSSQCSAIPIVWEVFNKNGNSNICERKMLMHRLIDIIGKENIAVVLADREFIGHGWIQFLHEQDMPFIIRVRKNMYVEYAGKRVKASDLFPSIKYKEKREFNVILDDIPVRLVATKSIEGELVIVIASMNITDDPLSQYRLRWLIELFFKSIKSRGFNLEETHMTDPEKIKKLFALVALATLIAVQAGIIRNHFKKISIKNHGRPTYSLFTYGLDFIRSLFRGKISKFFRTLDIPILSPPKEFEYILSKSENLDFALGMG